MGFGLPKKSGILIGAGLFAVSIGVLALLGYYTVVGINPWQVLIPAFAVAVVSGVFEELLFRGILFRILESWLGTWAGLAISALLFGLLHLINLGATLWAGIAVAIEAGILLAAAFVLTRRLWLAIGIHFAWNFVEGGVFGTPVSGNPPTGLFQAQLTGPAALTGGSFGPEASVIVVGLCLLVSVVMLRMAYQLGHFLKGGIRDEAVNIPGSAESPEAARGSAADGGASPGGRGTGGS